MAQRFHQELGGTIRPFTPEEEARADEFEARIEAEAPRRAALDEISSLEATVTNRRLREAALTDEGKAWLLDVEAQIKKLRANL